MGRLRAVVRVDGKARMGRRKVRRRAPRQWDGARLMSAWRWGLLGEVKGDGMGRVGRERGSGAAGGVSMGEGWGWGRVWGIRSEERWPLVEMLGLGMARIEEGACLK